MKVYRTFHKINSNPYIFYAGLFIFFACIIFLSTIYLKNTRPFPILGFTPELILEYQAGSNFHSYGFFKNLLLVDYSSSPDIGDHPYSYTHQFNIPAILIGILLKIKFSLIEIRLFFVLISLLGIFYLFLLIRSVTKNSLLALLVACLCCIFYDESFVYLEHSTHSFYYLIYFGGLYYLLRYIQSSKNQKLFLLAYLFFLSFGLLANIIAVTPLIFSALVFCFFYCRDKFLKVFIFTSITILTLIGFIFIRNGIVLGFEFAFNDLYLTFSNRVFATPTREELANFYSTNNVVLWGVQFFKPDNMMGWLSVPLKNSFAMLGYTVFIPFAYLLVRSQRFKRYYSDEIVQLTIIFLGSFSWHLLFLSYGTNYTFPFLDKMFFLYFVCVIFITYQYILKYWYFESKFLVQKRIYSLLLFGFIAAYFSLSFAGQAKHFLNYDFKHFIAEYKTIRTNKNIDVIQSNELELLLRGKIDGPIVIGTNLDGVIASFFAPGITIIGGCDLSGMLKKTGGKCLSNFNIKNRDARPNVLLYATTLIPGHTSCDALCLQKELQYLNKNFKKIPTGIANFHLFSVNKP